MNTFVNTSSQPPIVPPLPPQATWDQQMRHFEAQQRERNIGATQALNDAQSRAAKAAEAMLEQPMPQVQDYRLCLMVQLVSTMTSKQRANPAQAAARALAELAAINAALARP